MSIPFFNDILHALGRKVNYDAISNYAGNSFCKDSWDMIQKANPLTKPQRGDSGFMSMIANGINVKSKKKSIKGLEWAEGLFDPPTNDDTENDTENKEEG